MSTIQFIPKMLYALFWQLPPPIVPCATISTRAGTSKQFAKPAQLMPSAIRVVWPIPSPEPLVSVIIPTRDRADLLSQCLDGVLHRTEYSNLEVLIVNNESVEKDDLHSIRSTHPQ